MASDFNNLCRAVCTHSNLARCAVICSPEPGEPVLSKRECPHVEAVHGGVARAVLGGLVVTTDPPEGFVNAVDAILEGADGD